MINPNELCPGCMNKKVAEGKCPICGYNPGEFSNPSYLVPGSMLDSRYVIGKVIESNGEGVTYLGFDTVTAANVNIREFFPQGLCERDSDGVTVLMLSGSEYSYNDALVKFTELSRELFRLNELPALFDVLDVRESNNTAYRITRAVPGISLREFLMRNGGVLNWDQARSLFAPLVASISTLHSAGIIHRGISPDTLIVGKDGKLRLNGFCIAETRTAKSALTSQLFPGFAAVEQYGAAGTQGPWTDIYAFAATIYRTLVGNPPPEATERLSDDNMTIPAKIARETPKAVLETLANALQVLPDDRTQNVDEMRRGLVISSAQTAATPKAPKKDTSTISTSNVTDSDKSKPKKKINTGKMYGLVAGIVTAFLLAILIFFVLWITGIIGSDDGSTSSVQSSNGLSGVLSNINQDEEASKVESSTANKIVLSSYIGKNYVDVVADPATKDNLKFKIVSKQYSEEFVKGQIISQSPKSGDVVEIGTTIEVVVSLGSSNISMVDVIGLDRDSAVLKLLKAGFSYENIHFGPSRYDENAQPGVVIQSDPEKDMRISIDTKITLTCNSFTGEITTPPGSANSSSSENDSNSQ